MAISPSYPKHQQVGDDGSEDGGRECGDATHFPITIDNYGIFENMNANTTWSISNGNHNGTAKKEKLTYMNLLSKNSNYCCFLVSYLINQMGEWLTYFASLTLIQRVTAKTSAGTTQNANTMVSILILVKLLTNVVFLPIGGVIADSYDRRNIQILLDLLCSCVVVVFLWSLYTESIFLCLLANFLIATASGLYIPSNEAMIPQLLVGNSRSNSSDNDEALKKANVLLGMSWSLMTAVGSALGGILVAAFGVQACFVIDSVTYLTSAAIMYFGVEGNYNASTISRSINQGIENKHGKENPVDDECQSLLEERYGSTKVDLSDGLDDDDDSSDLDDNDDSGGFVLVLRGLQFLFLEEPLVGACALLKGSSSLVYGAVDVLNVAFSVRGSESDPSKTSIKLGLIFGCVGIGCIIGSALSDAFSDLSLPRRTARVGFCTWG